MIVTAKYAKDPLSGDIVSITIIMESGKVVGVPLDPANTDYQNIMKLVEDGELTIAPAEEPTE